MLRTSLFLITLLILLCGQTLFAKNTMSRIHAISNSQGVYVLTEFASDTNDDLFMIHHRKDNSKFFTSSDTLNGHVVKTTSYKNRLWVYFSSGSSQSYAVNKPRSEKSLPINTTLVAITFKDNNHYLILKATGDIQLSPYESINKKTEINIDKKHDINDTAEEPKAEPKAEPRAETVNFTKGQYVIVVSVNNSQWQVVNTQLLPLETYQDIHFMVNEDNVFNIYGMEQLNLYQNIVTQNNSEMKTTLFASDLIEYQLIQHNQTGIIVTHQKNELQESILTVYQVKQQQDVQSIQLHNKDNSPLFMNKNQWSIAATPKTIEVFSWDNDHKINNRSFDLEGQFIKEQPDCTFINPPKDYIWLRTIYAIETTEYISTAMIILVMFTAFNLQKKQTNVISQIQTASIFKRIIALIIDIFPCSFIASTIQSEIISVFIKMNEDSSTINAIELINYSPEYQLMQFKFYFTLSIIICLYFLLFEIFLQRTPGKMIMKLFIVNEQGETPTLLQTCLRNVVRILELYPRVPLFMLILVTVSHKKQRLGDLLAKTIVTQLTPEEIKEKFNRLNEALAKENKNINDETI